MALLAQFRIIHDEDPKAAIIRDVGPVGGIEIPGQYVLIGKYVRPADAKTAGGIIMGEAVVGDDRWQTKVGLVLKLGLRAFVDDGDIKFNGWKPEAGDWVAFRPSDGLSMQIGQHECRLVPDVHIKMRLSHPDAIY